jgi:hypothetical protein
MTRHSTERTGKLSDTRMYSLIYVGLESELLGFLFAQTFIREQWSSSIFSIR